MELIPINSPEYKAFAANAIINNERHVLEQLRESRASQAPNIRLIGGFYDDLKNTGTTETEEEQEERFRQEHNVVTGKEYYDFLSQL